MRDTDEQAAGSAGLWEDIYRSGRKINRYPYDVVVSFVLRRFGGGDWSRTRILDYGCGGGNHARFLVAEGFDTFAVDSSPTAVRLSLAAAAEVRPDVDPQHFQAADFRHLPFADAQFDAVIDRQSLGQNAAADLPAMVDEIHRVLAPGGVYFGINFGDGHPQLGFGRDLGNGDWADFSQGVFKGLGQKHFFSLAEITDLFAAFKLETVDVVRHETLLGHGGGSEEYIVVASKPA